MACGQVGEARQVNNTHLSSKQRRREAARGEHKQHSAHAERRSPPRSATLSRRSSASRFRRRLFRSSPVAPIRSVPRRLASLRLASLRSWCLFWGFFSPWVCNGRRSDGRAAEGWRTALGAEGEARVRVPARCSARDDFSGPGPSAGWTPLAAATMTTMRPSARASPPSLGARVLML